MLFEVQHLVMAHNSTLSEVLVG